MICDKKPYDSFQEAKRALANIRARAKRTHTQAPKRAYKCEGCGKYHLTSQK